MQSQSGMQVSLGQGEGKKVNDENHLQMYKEENKVPSIYGSREST